MSSKQNKISIHLVANIAISLSIILCLLTAYFGWPSFYYSIFSALALGAVFVSFHVRRGSWPVKAEDKNSKFKLHKDDRKLVLGALLFFSGASALYLFKGSGFLFGIVAMAVSLYGGWLVSYYVFQLSKGELYK